MAGISKIVMSGGALDKKYFNDLDLSDPEELCCMVLMENGLVMFLALF